MKAFRLQQFNGPDGLTLTESTTPTPAHDEVLVRVHASSLNFRDLLIAKGAFGPVVPSGVIPLSDGAGEVVAVGANVHRVSIGDRVCATYVDGWISGDRLDLGLGRGGDTHGMLAEYVCLNQDSVVRLPDHLSYAEGATLPCAALTAWNALCVYGRLLPGQTVLIQGTGSVSLFALQFAKLFGAHVIATTSSDEKAARLRKLGADEVINYRTNENWDQEVLRLSHGGADLIVEVGGAMTMPKSILAVRRGGRISVVGLLTGIPDAGFAPAFFGRFVRFEHIHVGSRDSFDEMNRAITHHRVKPIISKSFTFSQVKDAYLELAGASHFGKLVIAHS